MLRRLISSLVLIAVTAASVQALPINADPLAMSPWRGVANSFTSNPANTQYSSIQVSYAVYERPNFTSSGGFDPSNGFYKYIYAYQIFNVGVSTVPVGFFNIALETECPGITAYDGHKALQGGIVPDPDLAGKWKFVMQPLSPDKHSVVLLFATDHAPKWGNAIAKAGDFAQVSFNVPVPAPEPMTMSLLGLGFIGLARRFRK